MANIKSAKKRIKVNAKAAERNKRDMSALRTALKKAHKAIEEKADNREELAVAAMKKLDVAASKKLIHKNNAARKKSDIQRKLNASLA